MGRLGSRRACVPFLFSAKEEEGTSYSLQHCDLPFKVGTCPVQTACIFRWRDDVQSARPAVLSWSTSLIAPAGPCQPLRQVSCQVDRRDPTMPGPDGCATARAGHQHASRIRCARAWPSQISGSSSGIRRRPQRPAKPSDSVPPALLRSVWLTASPRRRDAAETHPVFSALQCDARPVRGDPGRRGRGLSRVAAVGLVVRPARANTVHVGGSRAPAYGRARGLWARGVRGPTVRDPRPPGSLPRRTRADSFASQIRAEYGAWCKRRKKKKEAQATSPFSKIQTIIVSKHRGPGQPGRTDSAP